MDYRLAEFVRFVKPEEILEDLVDEAKAETWINGREHAVIALDTGDLILVRGGRDGMELTVHERRGIIIEVQGISCGVRRVAWHTHPKPTGPSDHDFIMLERLEQTSSVIYEIGGDPQGTIFVQKERQE